MDCNRTQELMSLALDGQLTAEEIVEFNEHLSSCDDCADEYALYQSIHEGLNSLGEEETELPSGFHEELMANIAASSVTGEGTEHLEDKVVPLFRRFPRKYMNLAAVFALVAVFALIGINNLDQIMNSSDEAPMMMESAREDRAVEEASIELVTEDEAEMAEAPEAEMAVTESAEMTQEEVAGEPASAMMTELPEVEEQEAAFDDSKPVTLGEETVTQTDEADLALTVEFNEAVESEPVSDAPVAKTTDETALSDLEENKGNSGDAASDSGLSRDGDDSERLPKSVEYGDSELSAEPEEDGNTGIWMLFVGLLTALVGGVVIFRRRD